MRSEELVGSVSRGVLSHALNVNLSERGEQGYPALHGPRAQRRAPRSSEILLTEECLLMPRTVI